MDGVYLLFSLGIVSHNCNPNLLIPSISFLFTKLLQKAFDGWGAANSEGWDIESCEYDVSWMDGVEDLANEVRIHVAFIVTFLYKIPDIISDIILLLSFRKRCPGWW